MAEDGHGKTHGPSTPGATFSSVEEDDEEEEMLLVSCFLSFTIERDNVLSLRFTVFVMLKLNIWKS